MDKLFFKVWRNQYICFIIFYYLKLYKTYRNYYTKDLINLKSYQWRDYINNIIFTNQFSRRIKIKKSDLSNNENIKSIQLLSDYLDIEDNSIPESITNLEIGNLEINKKTTSPPMDIIKALNRIYTYNNLKSLSLRTMEYKINLKMNETNQFDKLTKLCLNFWGTEIFILSKLSFPINLKSLHIRCRMITCELNEDTFPLSLTFLNIDNNGDLKIKSLYNTNIKDFIIRNFLTKRLSSLNILPKKLDKFFFTFKYDHLFSSFYKEYLPEGIRVICTLQYPKEILSNCNYFPNSLKYFRYMDHDNLPITYNTKFGLKSIFPNNLKYLYLIGVNFNQPLNLLPPSINHLVIKSYTFNQSLNYDGCLPPNLISLDLSYSYFWNLKYSNENFNDKKFKLEFTHIPSSLKILKFTYNHKKLTRYFYTLTQLENFIIDFNFLSIDKLKTLHYLLIANLVYYN